MPKLPRPITRKVAGKLATKKVRALHGNAGKQERALYNQLKGQKKAIRSRTCNIHMDNSAEFNKHRIK